MTAHRVREWLIFSDIHILFVAVGWMLGNSALFGYTLPNAFLALASVGAFLVYRMDRLLVDSPEDVLNAPERVHFGVRYRWPLLLFAGLLTLLAAVAALSVRVVWLEVAIFIGVVGMLYPVRFLPGGRRPKDIAWLKTLLIVGCWVGGGVVLPLVLFGSSSLFDTGVTTNGGLVLLLLIAAYRTLYILPNLLAADWLDRRGDEAAGAGNLLQSWSIRRTGNVILGSAGLGTLSACVLMSQEVALPLVLLDLMGMWVLAIASRRLVNREDAWDATSGGPAAARMIVLDLLVAWPVLVWLASRMWMQA